MMTSSPRQRARTRVQLAARSFVRRRRSPSRSCTPHSGPRTSRESSPPRRRKRCRASARLHGSCCSPDAPRPRGGAPPPRVVWRTALSSWRFSAGYECTAVAVAGVLGGSELVERVGVAALAARDRRARAGRRCPAADSPLRQRHSVSHYGGAGDGCAEVWITVSLRRREGAADRASRHRRRCPSGCRRGRSGAPRRRRGRGRARRRARARRFCCSCFPVSSRWRRQLSWRRCTPPAARWWADRRRGDVRGEAGGGRASRQRAWRRRGYGHVPHHRLLAPRSCAEGCRATLTAPTASRPPSRSRSGAWSYARASRVSCPSSMPPRWPGSGLWSATEAPPMRVARLQRERQALSGAC